MYIQTHTYTHTHTTTNQKDAIFFDISRQRIYDSYKGKEILESLKQCIVTPKIKEIYAISCAHC